MSWPASLGVQTVVERPQPRKALRIQRRDSSYRPGGRQSPQTSQTLSDGLPHPRGGSRCEAAQLDVRGEFGGPDGGRQIGLAAHYEGVRVADLEIPGGGNPTPVDHQEEQPVATLASGEFERAPFQVALDPALTGGVYHFVRIPREGRHLPNRVTGQARKLSGQHPLGEDEAVHQRGLAGILGPTEHHTPRRQQRRGYPGAFQRGAQLRLSGRSREIGEPPEKCVQVQLPLLEGQGELFRTPSVAQKLVRRTRPGLGEPPDDSFQRAEHHRRAVEVEFQDLLLWTIHHQHLVDRTLLHDEKRPTGHAGRVDPSTPSSLQQWGNHVPAIDTAHRHHGDPTVTTGGQEFESPCFSASHLSPWWIRSPWWRYSRPEPAR